jgi:hypothetical protein
MSIRHSPPHRSGTVGPMMRRINLRVRTGENDLKLGKISIRRISHGMGSISHRVWNVSPEQRGLRLCRYHQTSGYTAAIMPMA